MTPAEKMAQRLEVRAEIRRKIPRAEKDRIATDCEDAAALIRRLAAALVAAEMHIRGLSTIKGPEYASFTIPHADALRDVKEMP